MLYFTEISYKGKYYHGWQKQPNAISVQSVIESAFQIILRKTAFSCIGCGRTDAGVHAKQFYFHFETEEFIDFDKFVFKINTLLPDDITVYRILEVPEGSHTRFDAISRTYQYFINKKKDPFITDTSFYYSRKLNVNLMNEACQVLFDFTDFTSFSKVKTETKTNNCEISFAEWKQEGDVLFFKITADRFLRNMVRAIVGTMLEVGLEKISVPEFKRIIERKNRGEAGTSVPGHGLFLTQVKYDFNLLEEPIIRNSQSGL